VLSVGTINRASPEPNPVVAIALAAVPREREREREREKATVALLVTSEISYGTTVRVSSLSSPPS